MKRWLLIVAALLVLLAAGTYLFARSALASDLARRQLEQQLTAKLGEPVKIGTLAARIYPGIAVDLGAVSIGDPEKLRVERLRVFTGIRALFGDTIDIRRVDVTNGRPGGAVPVSFDLSASVLGDRLDVGGLVLRAPSTRIDAKGTLTSIANVEGAFDAESGALDINELIAIAGALAPPSAPKQGASQMHLVLRLKAARVRFGEDQFTDLSTTIDAVPARVTFGDLALRLFGGTFKGRLDADTRQAAPAVRLNGRADGLDVAALLKRTGSAGGVTGRLSCTVSLAAQGADGAALLRTARGTIDATIAKGTLPRLDIVRTVVLAFGKPSSSAPREEGTAFDTLGGTFALANGTLRSENLSLRSRDVDTDGRGALAIDSGGVDARADVMLSQELTAQAGTDLRRYALQDGRVVVPATVSGTLGKPTVFIDLAAAGKRAIGNEIRRRATDFLGGLFKKKKGGG